MFRGKTSFFPPTFLFLCQYAYLLAESRQTKAIGDAYDKNTLHPIA